MSVLGWKRLTLHASPGMRTSLLLPVVAVALATALRLASNQWLGTSYVFGIFYLAVAVAAWYGGLRAGLLATVLSGIATAFVLRKSGVDLLTHVGDQVEWSIFLASAVALTVLFESVEKARRETAEARHALASLIEVAPIGIALFDRDMRYRSVNATLASMNGMPECEHLGRRIDELFPDVAPYVEEVFRSVLASGRPVTALEFSAKTRATAAERTWSEAWFPVHDAEGRVALVGALVQDVTERKNAERALQEADRQKDRFVAVLAHELRNVMVPMTNAVAIQRSGAASAEQSAKAFEMLDRQLDHMSRLIADLLDISAVTSGTLTLRKARTDLRHAIQDSIEMAQPVVEAKSHKLWLTLPSRPVHVWADRQRLAQAFCNIITNAAKYTPEHGRIEVTLQASESRASIYFKDNGSGIEPELLPRIFDIFVRGGAQLQTTEGLGIGLNLVKRLVELHGGTIEAHSAGAGRGTEMVVRLPLHARIEPPEAEHTNVR